MSTLDDHHHHEGNWETRGYHGLIPPPGDAVLHEYEPPHHHAAGARDDRVVRDGGTTTYEPTIDPARLLHHWQAPPGPAVRASRPYRVRVRDGTTRVVQWRMPWYLDRVEGCSRSKAITRLYDVLLDPRGWINAGVHWVRVRNRAQAKILFRVIPAAETVCGPGSAGCFSWGYPDGKTIAENGVEYIDRDNAWQAITGMEAQGHGTFLAHDLYINHPEFNAIPTVMGTWKSMAQAGYRPTEADLYSAKLFLAGKTDPSKVHRH
jgi:hypothetical protein